MLKKTILFLIILVFATFSIAGMQQDRGPKQRMCPGCNPREDMRGPHHGELGSGFGSWLFPGKWWKIPKIQKDLQLSDEQIIKLEDIFLKQKSEMIDIRANIQKKQLEIENLLDKEKVDDKIILQKVDELITIRGNLQKNYIKMILDMRKILTPDQLKKLKDIRASVRSRVYKKYKNITPPASPTPPSPPPPPSPEL